MSADPRELVSAPEAMTATATPDLPGDDEREPRWRAWPVVAMVAAGVVLYAFYAYSQTRPPIAFGYFAHPPLYGIFAPTLDRLALTVIPAGLLLAAAAWLATTAVRRIPTWLALALFVVLGVATAAAIALVRGDTHDLTKGVSTAPKSPYYSGDLHFIDQYGVRGFVERHPALVDAYQSYNSKTHPPGVHLLLYAVFRLFGASHTLRITTALAALALCTAAAAWLIGRTLGGERAGRIGAVLFVAAPGPLLLAYTILDGVFALFLATAVGLFMLAIHRLSVSAAAAAGAVLAVGTLMTFATAFVALAAAVAVVAQTRSVRSSLRLLGAAVAGGLATIVAARLVLGFDLLAIYQSVPGTGRPYDAYWAFASPAACLIWAGLPLAALGVVGLFRKVPGARRAVLPLVLVLVMVLWAALPSEITKLRPGEVERTWAFLYPVLAGTAGPVVDRWTRGAGRWSGAVVAALVVLSVAQAVLIQALWNTEVSNV
jgi:hypothetical protein